MTKPIVSFDDLSYGQTMDVPVLHPKTKKEIGTITLAGPGHPQVLKFEEDERKRNTEEAMKWAEDVDAAKLAGKRPPPPPEAVRSMEQIRKDNALRLAAHVVGASFSVQRNGDVIDLDSETAVPILADPSLSWLYEIVFSAVRNRENFIKSSDQG